ncbi:MAG: PH domain-containing protein [Planctomycetes bacterium]|nr:PH domain-containing protein [Planctomycetota bacterium]
MTEDLGTDFTWQAHPARERIGTAALGLSVIGAITGAVGLSFQSPVWAAAALLVLLAALSRFFFPSRFLIDADGITARYLLGTQQIRWRDIRRFVQDHRGGYISTRAKRSWLDAYRGMHILFGTDREAVIERIRARLSDGAGAWAH